MTGGPIVAKKKTTRKTQPRKAKPSPKPAPKTQVRQVDPETGTVPPRTPRR